MVPNTKKNMDNRPLKEESRVAEKHTRPMRPSVSSRYEKLSVKNKDPDYAYRLVLDKNDTGAKITGMLDCGWEFADGKKHAVGDRSVHNISDRVSVVRIRDGNSDSYLYLMRIRKEWYEEDQKELEKLNLNKVTVAEDTLRKSEGSGIYGQVNYK